jgi:hypothetical protein
LHGSQNVRLVTATTGRPQGKRSVVSKLCGGTTITPARITRAVRGA